MLHFNQFFITSPYKLESCYGVLLTLKTHAWLCRITVSLRHTEDS